MSLGAWDTAVIAVKTISYAATLGAAGAAIFLGYSAALIAGADAARIRRMVLGLSVLAVCAGGAQILVSAGSLGGGLADMVNGSLVSMVWQTGTGHSCAIRAGGLLLAVLASPQRHSWRPAAGAMSIIGAMLAATSFAWTGHARSLDPNSLPLLLLGIHLLGVAFWLGALAPLLIVARDPDPSHIAAAAARFGALALFVVGGLLAAGLGLLWLMLGGIGELWNSSYGRYVMLKLTFVAGLLGLAAFNKLRLTPRLLAGDAGAMCSLRTSIRFELLLGASILAITATFTSVTGPPALG